MDSQKNGGLSLYRLRRFWGRVVAWLLRLKKQRSFRRSVVSFVRDQQKSVQIKFLTQMDPGRVVSLLDFQDFARDNFSSVKTVAVVSGSEKEPELLFLPSSIELTQLNFSDNPELFDLQKDWSKPEWAAHHRKYDLVLCEQVLEHLLDPQLAVENLAKIVSTTGIVHLSVPAINNRHGEPTYFYSGFAFEILEYWLRKSGLSVKNASSWNSNKGARMYSTSDWAPLAESGPLVFFFLAVFLLWKEPANLGKVFVRRIRNCLRYPYQPLFPARDTKNAVVSWVFAAKNADAPAR